MTTKEQIIKLADTLIRQKGYNAFSFNDISKTVGIKTASIHYHFPAKTDLGVAVIEEHIAGLSHIIDKYKTKSPVEQLENFFAIYLHIKNENKVCLIGSLSTDLNTIEEAMKEKLKVFTSLMIDWVSCFLEEGKNDGSFQFEGLPRTKAVMMITNMLAIVQLSRLTGDEDVEAVKNTIKQELLKS